MRNPENQQLVGCPNDFGGSNKKRLVFTVYLFLVAGFPEFNQPAVILETATRVRFESKRYILHQRAL